MLPMGPGFDASMTRTVAAGLVEDVVPGQGPEASARPAVVSDGHVLLRERSAGRVVTSAAATEARGDVVRDVPAPDVLDERGTRASRGEGAAHE